MAASVAMVHSVPELIVSEQQAKELGQADEERLLKSRKLVLLVDLDQTLIHTTNDNIPPNLKDVYHFQLAAHGQQGAWFHTKFRPHTEEFLSHMSELYELHICTFGARLYAHTIAHYLDPHGIYFSHRILSRDEFFNATSKTANLKALFPCGDSMACIIDDREDVWNFAPNLVHVKPYLFFVGTADINSPPDLDAKTNNPGKETCDADKESGTHSKRVVKLRRVRKKSLAETCSAEGKAMGTSINKTQSNPESPKNVVSNGNNEKEEASEIKEPTEKKTPEAGECRDTGKTAPAIEQAELGTRVASMERKVQEPSEKAQFEEPETEGEAAEDIQEKEPSDDGKESGPVCGGGATDTDVGEKTKNTETLPQTVADAGAPSDDVLKGSGDKAANESEQPAGADANRNVKSGAGSGNVKDWKLTENTEDKKIREEDSDNEYEEIIEWVDNDDYLHYLEDVLKKIHSAFYEVYDQLQSKGSKEKKDMPDLKNIIPYVRRKVLKGTSILFSGVFPTNQPPEKTRAYLTAKSLGANIQMAFVPPGETGATTHLIAAKLGTAKVNAVRRHRGIQVVTVDWLWCCADRWEWVDERLFPLNDTTQSIHSRGSSPDLVKMGRNSQKRKRDDDGTSRSRSRSKHDDGNGEAAQPSTSTASGAATSAQKIGEQRRFSETVSPMYALSRADWDSMGKEVQDMLDSSSESESDSAQSSDEERQQNLRRQVLGHPLPEESSSDSDSLSGDFPHGWKNRKRKRKDIEEGGCTDEDEVEGGGFLEISSDSDRDEDDFEHSVGSADEEMAAALEKELLS